MKNDKAKKKKTAERLNIKKPVSIVSNRIKTPDGTILVSRHCHDFVGHTDKITGKFYAVDGGSDNLKRTGDNAYEELSVTTADHFELIRKMFEWGSYGKDGRGALRWMTLCNMSDIHIKAIIDTQEQISEQCKNIFKKELAYRKIKKISVKDKE